MTTEQKIEWAIIAGQVLLALAIIPLALWLGVSLPGEAIPRSQVFIAEGATP